MANRIPERTAWRTVASTYVICTHDRAVDPALQQRLATSHSPFVSRPDLVVGLPTEPLRHHQPTAS